MTNKERFLAGEVFIYDGWKFDKFKYEVHNDVTLSASIVNVNWRFNEHEANVRSIGKLIVTVYTTVVAQLVVKKMNFEKMTFINHGNEN